MKPSVKLNVETLEDRVVPSGIDTHELNRFNLTFDSMRVEHSSQTVCTDKVCFYVVTLENGT